MPQKNVCINMVRVGVVGSCAEEVGKVGEAVRSSKQVGAGGKRGRFVQIDQRSGVQSRPVVRPNRNLPLRYVPPRDASKKSLSRPAAQPPALHKSGVANSELNVS